MTQKPNPKSRTILKLQFPKRSHLLTTGNWKLEIGYSRRSRAFTLVELLVVIAIIGILIGIAAASWVTVAARGRDSTRKSDLSRLKNVLAQYYSDRRTYPIFDAERGVIFAASWQLAPGDACVHTGSPTLLVPKYIASIPKDPSDTTDYGTDCETLTAGQANRYLYITSPTDEGGPQSPTGFGLLATLERPGNEVLDDTANPLKTTLPNFGPWYAGQSPYNEPLLVNANYLVTEKN